MKKQYRQMVETRRVYHFERCYLHPEHYPHSSKERSERFLQALAVKVWAKYGRKNCRVPTVRVEDGLDVSYCLGYTDIRLATKKNTRDHFPHNTVEVLLHELTHAMGHGTHGKGFTRKYHQLLVEFGKCDSDKLIIDMADAGIRI